MFFITKNGGTHHEIGVDIDGVLTYFERWQLDTGSKFFSKYGKHIMNPDGYDTDTIFGASEELDSKFWNKYLFDYAENEPARKFASEIIKKLKDNGHEIFIITRRFLTDRQDSLGQKMRETVLTWLSNNNIIFDEIIFKSDDKFNICKHNKIDVMIEDKVKTINRLSTIIPVICFDARYNKECVGPNIFRAYSWYDVYKQINKIIEIKTKYSRLAYEQSFIYNAFETKNKGGNYMRTKFKITGLDCANCAAKLERAIQKIDGVQKADLSFFTERLVVDCDDDKHDSVMADMKKLIKKTEPDVELKQL